MEVIEELAANSRSWSKERHSSRRIAAVENSAIDVLAKVLAAVRSKVDRMGSPRRDGEIQNMEDVNYIQNGGQNSQYNNNNYRPNQGGNNYNNYSGNRPHPNLSYSNNNCLESPAGFSVLNGAINEPKKESVKDMFKRYMQKNEGEKKVADNRVNVMEGTMAKMSENLSRFTTYIAMMDTQMSQMHKIILDIEKRNKEEDAKAAARLEKINKEWAKQYWRPAETAVSGPLIRAGASGPTTGPNPEEKGELSGPPKPLQRSAEYDGHPEQIVRHNGIPLPLPAQKENKAR